MDDSREFCEKCGTPAPAAAFSQGSTKPSVPAKFPGAGAAPEVIAKATKNPLIVAVAGVLVGVLLTLFFAVLIPSCGGGGYKKVINRFEKLANGKGDEEVLEKLYPEDYWRRYEKNYDMDVKDVYKERYKDNIEDLADYIDDSLDIKMDEKDIKIKYDIVYTYKFNKNELEALNEDLDEEKIDEASAAYGVGVRITYDFNTSGLKKGEIKDLEERYGSYVTEFTVVKIGGKWYNCP